MADTTPTRRSTGRPARRPTQRPTGRRRRLPTPRTRALTRAGLAAMAALAASTAAIVVSRRTTGRSTGRTAGSSTGSRRARTGHAVAHTSTTRRNAELLRVGARTGSGYAAHRARRVFADAARREELDREFELRSAEQVAEALGQMKGALMKVGQMASYLDQGLPEHVRSALAELQQDAPPMSPELAAGVIEAELGAGPDEVFAEWDPVPIASASIGQVHRAITHDGEAVAVKVQYPGVDEAVAADLDNVGLLFAGMGQLFPGFDHKPFVAEVRERLVEELDYSLEADHQRLFTTAYAEHPYIHVPAVHDALSTRRVLTTELADGVGWSELLTWDPDERNLAAETLYRFAFGSLYRLAAFNGDPHPGNYLFRPGGQVTFLDFGLVKRFAPDEVDAFGHLIEAIVLEDDPTRFRALVEGYGLLKPDEPFTDQQVVDYFGHFYELVTRTGVHTLTAEYATETVRRYFDQRGPHGEIMRAANLPPAFVIIQRINLGLYALFGELEATADWRSLAEEIWPFVSAPPATPMGEAIAAWERRRADR